MLYSIILYKYNNSDFSKWSQILNFINFKKYVMEFVVCRILKFIKCKIIHVFNFFNIIYLFNYLFIIFWIILVMFIKWYYFM